MPRDRLGVALLLPPPVAGEVDGLRRALGDPVLGRIPAHLTLVPPVNVRTERLADALAVLRRAAAATRPFVVELGPPATFLPVNPVAYLAVGGDTASLERLRAIVLREPLARSLSRPFVPHVTIADEAAPARIVQAVAALGDYRVTVTFDRVHLLREGEGRVWEPVADAMFAAPAIVGRGGLPLELTVSDALDPELRGFVEREEDAAARDELGSGSARRPFAVSARREGEPVGVAAGWTGGGVGWIRSLVVPPAHRGEGVGSRLLAACESLAADRGCRRLGARAVAGSRIEAFYRGRGWVEEWRARDWAYGRDWVELRRDL